ncbi:ligase-associated DNA damage response endonuclease PdeM [Pseudooctadecabacter jejudonensis]|uniref:Calcineurin-like phosphoesterase n=1 Tax=Pseudooctadecabacter jejudonensis TaxID=1391910 RepID=A0A1Y5SYF9_9RHOB|nr:ligase-associated DNA damage response endonuclease PdeM [Pseudooctadecabacter jejudonensis]SLN49781.1 Calcineurin-like phosphoesterase [Pseudooctadecabacter jejudonensis]
MNDYAFTFADVSLVARADGSLWWPEKAILCVSDLHLGKSDRIARRGGTLLPPYETQETLWQLQEAIADTSPKTVICLGDSFDDLGAAMSLPADMQKMIAGLQAGRNWIWIEGNHDPGPVELGGSHLLDYHTQGLVFRHIATAAGCGEISGHYHPKAGVPGLRQVRSFLIDQNRVIMPSFGAYTGGLSAASQPLRDLMLPDGLAILTGSRAIPMPLSALVRPQGARR